MPPIVGGGGAPPVGGWDPQIRKGGWAARTRRPIAREHNTMEAVSVQLTMDEHVTAVQLPATTPFNNTEALMAAVASAGVGDDFSAALAATTAKWPVGFKIDIGGDNAEDADQIVRMLGMNVEDPAPLSCIAIEGSVRLVIKPLPAFAMPVIPVYVQEGASVEVSKLGELHIATNAQGKDLGAMLAQEYDGDLTLAYLQMPGKTAGTWLKLVGSPVTSDTPLSALVTQTIDSTIPMLRPPPVESLAALRVVEPAGRRGRFGDF